MKLISALVAFGLAPTLPSQEALACQVVRVPTASEITAQAEVIVRAKAVASDRRKVDDFGGEVTFEILEILKGDFDGKQMLRLSGQTERYYGRNDRAVPYDFVRPGGRHGDCAASDYKLATEFLLFLRSGTDKWAPLAATNEEVTGAEDPWVAWVKDELAGTHRGQ